MDRALTDQFAAIVSPENCLASEEDRLCYGHDASRLAGPPDLVLLPASTEEVSRIMALAHQHSVPVTPRGTGTGMTGGAVPACGGIVLAMGRCNRILEIDTANHLAVVEPGVLNGDLKAAARKHGLFYPPDPASAGFCTIGGNVAENAGGPSAVKYGVTRDYVRALTVVLADGRILHTGERTAKGVVGYDLTRLFTGSEGTLGIITRIVLRLLPLPERKATVLALFAGVAAATALVPDLVRGFSPCTLEYMDRTAIGLVRDALPAGAPADAGGLLLIELDGDEEAVTRAQERLVAFLRATPALAVLPAADQEEAAALWQARRALSPAAFDLRPDKLSEDVVVPRDRIPELVTFAETLAAELDLPIFTFGHAGDGNIHVNIMHDARDPAEAGRAAAAKERIFVRTLELGGTLSGEHGIGLTKAPFLDMELDATATGVMRAVKQALDPKGILNPGKIFPGPAPAGRKIVIGQGAATSPRYKGGGMDRYPTTCERQAETPQRDRSSPTP